MRGTSLSQNGQAADAILAQQRARQEARVLLINRCQFIKSCFINFTLNCNCLKTTKCSQTSARPRQSGLHPHGTHNL